MIAQNRTIKFPDNLPHPQRRALEKCGITSLDQLQRFTQHEILALRGIGTKTIDALQTSMASSDLTFRTPTGRNNELGAHDACDGDRKSKRTD